MSASGFRRTASLTPVLAVLLACDAGVPPRPYDPDAARHPTVAAEALPVCAPESAPLLIEVVAEGLEVPWDLAFPGDGRILLTERPGRIRVVRDGRLEERPWAVLDVWVQGEAGLMGIEARGDTAWVAATFDAGRNLLRSALDRIRTATGRLPEHRIRTRVVRLIAQHPSRTAPGSAVSSPPAASGAGSTRGEAPARPTQIQSTVLTDGIPAGFIHAGGALRRGPDGSLVLGTGDAGIVEHAGDRRTPAGAILQIGGRGEPDDVIATGVRNAQGIAWHPSGVLFATDHGPSGLLSEDRRRGHDELLRIDSGADYGWPVEAGRADPPLYRPPLLLWTDAIAPSALTFWTPDGPWHGDAFIAALAARDLIRVDLDESLVPVCTRRLLDGRFGRIRAVRMGPDGWLYFTTSNRDGRGQPAPGDDRLLRIRPGAD